MKIDILNEIFQIHEIENIEIFYPKYILSYLEKYSKYLQDHHIEEEICVRVQEFTRNIYVCLAEYYVGQLESSRCYFKEAIKKLDVENLSERIMHSVFFRARSNEDKLCKQDEMFHIPFEKRYLVSTQRYSYPGLPCLYLGTSIEVCCEEIGNREQFLNVANVNIKDGQNETVLDLLFFDNYEFDDLSQDQFKKFLQYWPLVFCCSTHYAEKEKMKFRPDYIIPQMLLEYIIDLNAENALAGVESKMIGIKYHSVRKPILQNVISGKKDIYTNYVFPVLSKAEKGFCEKLSNMFEVGEVKYLKDW